MNAEQLAESLCRGEPAVIGVVDGGRLLLNLRSVAAEQDMRLVEAAEGLDKKGARNRLPEIPERG
jgi:hypothetical protein